MSYPFDGQAPLESDGHSVKKNQDIKTASYSRDDLETDGHSVKIMI